MYEVWNGGTGEGDWVVVGSGGEGGFDATAKERAGEEGARVWAAGKGISRVRLEALIELGDGQPKP